MHMHTSPCVSYWMPCQCRSDKKNKKATFEVLKKYVLLFSIAGRKLSQNKSLSTIKKLYYAVYHKKNIFKQTCPLNMYFKKFYKNVRSIFSCFTDRKPLKPKKEKKITEAKNQSKFACFVLKCDIKIILELRESKK